MSSRSRAPARSRITSRITGGVHGPTVIAYFHCNPVAMHRLKIPASYVAFGWFVTVVLFAVSGCDGSGASKPTPSATFSASVSGDTSATLSGSARVTSSASVARFGGAIPVPDSNVVDLPPFEMAQGTIIALTTEPASASPVSFSSGTTITMFVPDDGDLSPGEYSFADSQTTGVIGSPGLPAVAFYAELNGTSFRTAPATSGAITIDRVTPEGVFGSFRFTTDQAVTVRVTQPVDSTDISEGTPEPFATTIEGSFEAERFELEEGQPPLMFERTR